MSPLSPPSPPAGLVVLYDDNHLLVVDKPAGLLTQPARAGDDSLLDRARAWVKRRYNKPGNVYIGIVQRLDRNVSGVVVLARTSKAAGRLSAAFRERRVDKRYLGVVEGRAPATLELEHRLSPHERGVVVDPRGKLARLRARRISEGPASSLLEITLLTGRKHQIRAQLAAAGYPLVADPRYGRRSVELRRPALHALRLEIAHPVGGAPLSFVAPLPSDLAHLLRRRGLSWSGARGARPRDR